MTAVLGFLSEYIWVYLWLIGTTFVNIVAPTSGSTVINPVTAFFTDPQRAIGIGGFIFFLTGLHRVYLFRKEIFAEKRNVDMIRAMLPYSIVGAIMGGFVISYIPIKPLVVIIVIVSTYFIYKTLRQIILRTNLEKKSGGLGFAFIATFSGFLQSSGMPGSDMRNGYLRTTLSEVSVRAVGSAIGLVNFLIAGTIIFLHDKLTTRDMIFVATVTPFLIPAQIYGKKFLDAMSDRNAKIVAISLSLLGVILLTYKYLL
jgi:uncharacterized membrane protein YfcA